MAAVELLRPPRRTRAGRTRRGRRARSGSSAPARAARSISRLASAVNWGMLADVEARTSPAIPCGPRHMYSIESQPPHDCPSRWQRSRPSASRTWSTSSHGAVERPQRRVVRLVRAAAAELVVDDGRAVRGHGARRAARRSSSPRRGHRAGSAAASRSPPPSRAVPDAAARDVDRAFLAHAGSLDERAGSELTAAEKCSLGRPSSLPAGIRTAAIATLVVRPEPIDSGY